MSVSTLKPESNPRAPRAKRAGRSILEVGDKPSTALDIITVKMALRKHGVEPRDLCHSLGRLVFVIVDRLLLKG